MTALQHTTDNRFFPRIHLNKPVTIRLPDGHVLADHVWDISEIGFQLRCDRATALRIHPEQSAINETQSPKIALAIRFPYPSNLPEIEVDCRLRYVNINGPDEVAFGVMFEEFQGEGAQHFDLFIQQCLMPVCPPLI